jgi:hypothetical protein
MQRATALLAVVFSACIALSLRAQEIDPSPGEPLAYVPPPLGWASNSFSGETYVPPPLGFWSSSSAGNQFPNYYDGADMTFVGSVNLFNNNTLDQRITINNTTTFAGGWSANGGIASSTESLYIQNAVGLIYDPSTLIYTNSAALAFTIDVSGSANQPDGPVLGSSGILLSYTYIGDADLSGAVAGTELIGTWQPTGDAAGLELMPAYVELVPEPSTVILSGCGGALLALMWRRSRRSQPRHA